MAFFNSTSWTGRAPGGTLVIERPPLKSAKLEARPVVPDSHESHLAEYAEVAALVGVAAPDMAIEDFKTFLRRTDIPVFSLTEVVAYMDNKAAKESKEKCGWEWHPLRAADHLADVKFGIEPTRSWESTRSSVIFTIPASDFYVGPHVQTSAGFGVGQTFHFKNPGNRVYDKTVPLHALRKVALIGKKFGEAVKFFVCDYALAPAIQYPDPFLMAVVPNADLDKGVGRFVIDFWDEPGFGLEQRFK